MIAAPNYLLRCNSRALTLVGAVRFVQSIIRIIRRMEFEPRFPAVPSLSEALTRLPKLAVRSSVILPVLASALCAALLAVGSVGTARADLPAGFIETQIASGWSGGIGVTFTTDGRMFAWERNSFRS